eukprot:189429-Chlamydomonas_euryale.AAC.6
MRWESSCKKKCGHPPQKGVLRASHIPRGSPHARASVTSPASPRQREVGPMPAAVLQVANSPAVLRNLRPLPDTAALTQTGMR